MSKSWQDEVEEALGREAREALCDLARQSTAKVLRFLTGRLCSANEEEKWRAVWGLGVLVGDRQLVS